MHKRHLLEVTQISLKFYQITCIRISLTSVSEIQILNATIKHGLFTEHYGTRVLTRGKSEGDALFLV